MKPRTRIPIALLGAGILAAGCGDSPASPPVPASLSIIAGDAQTGTTAEPLAIEPAVMVRDAAGSPLEGVLVGFNVVAGGGTVAHPIARTDAAGRATAGRWTLGPVAGENVLEAVVAGLHTVRFIATGIAPFTITFRITGNPIPSQRVAVERAMRRWSAAITSDLSDVRLVVPAGRCFAGQPAIDEVVDDVLIFVGFGSIDGVGRVIGQAGPCYIRTESALPIMGYLQLDAADLPRMESLGLLEDLVLHEIGHVLGFGTVWHERELLSGARGPDPRFTGEAAVLAYRHLSGGDGGVPVENTGGSGTRDSHWRESVFGSELMTGYLSAATNPLSTLTLASLADLGYRTDPAAASSYRLAAAIAGAIEQLDLTRHESVHTPLFRVDATGRATRIRFE